ncbi:MAG: alternative oxidase [Ilumatobacter sp.]|uniref:alternative oxidase n=1 Tax=Ilumatobacter sp. TaxID=1967498 RepID=UPI003297ADE6
MTALDDIAMQNPNGTSPRPDPVKRTFFGGPASEAIGERPAFGPMKRLAHDELVAEQRLQIDTPRRSYSRSAKLLFAVVDLAYGKERTFEKFRVIEVVARVPYMAWESVAYVAMTHTSKRTDFARRVYDRALVARFEQDNEQWHLLILEELTKDRSRSRLRGRILPQVLAIAYYQLSWMMFAVSPKWSYRLNADFEDHAAHEYAYFVDENPGWESEAFISEFEGDYGSYDSLADMFRQIGYDEVVHRDESVAMMSQPRYR